MGGFGLEGRGGRKSGCGGGCVGACWVLRGAGEVSWGAGREGVDGDGGEGEGGDGWVLDFSIQYLIDH